MKATSKFIAKTEMDTRVSVQVVASIDMASDSINPANEPEICLGVFGGKVE